MDIQEIARLHSRYNEAPLIIDMPADSSGAPLLQAPRQSTSAASKPFWTRLSEAQRLIIALLIVAGIAFPIGMWAASAGKHNSEPPGARADQATKSTVPESKAAVERDHEWPAKAPTQEAEPNPQASAQQDLASHRPDSNATPASAANAAPASSAAAPAVAPTSMTKPPSKAPAVAARPAAAVAPAAVAPAPARTTTQTIDSRRGNEIKLF